MNLKSMSPLSKKNIHAKFYAQFGQVPPSAFKTLSMETLFLEYELILA